MKIAVVTGGCGFVGRRYVCRLLQLGYKVKNIDNLSSGLAPENWPEFQNEVITKFSENHIFINGDARDYFKTNIERIDLIIHLAAIVGGRLVIENDPISVATDLSIDAEFFNWLMKTNPVDALYYSSSAAYPIKLQTRKRHVILRETDIELDNIQNPDMSYGWSKLTGEYLASFTKKSPTNIYIFRPFSGYGEDQDFTYPFPSIIKRVLDKQDPIDVWSTGEQSRDFIYIDDCLDISLKLIQLKKTGTYNLSTGIKTTFIDLINNTINVAKNIGICDETYNPILNKHLDKPEGVFHRVGSPIKVLKELDDVFYFTTLDEGISKTLKYMEGLKNEI